MLHDKIIVDIITLSFFIHQRFVWNIIDLEMRWDLSFWNLCHSLNSQCERLPSPIIAGCYLESRGPYRLHSQGPAWPRTSWVAAHPRLSLGDTTHGVPLAFFFSREQTGEVYWTIWIMNRNIVDLMYDKYMIFEIYLFYCIAINKSSRYDIGIDIDSKKFK